MLTIATSTQHRRCKRHKMLSSVLRFMHQIPLHFQQQFQKPLLVRELCISDVPSGCIQELDFVYINWRT